MQHSPNHRYVLPIAAMIETMKRSPEVMHLETTLPSIPRLSRERCQAQVMVGQGQVQSCLIVSSEGKVLAQQQDAYQALGRCGDLEWSVRPAASLTPGGAWVVEGRREGAPSSLVLRVPLTPGLLSQLPHAPRCILALVDGHRSLEEIAHLLTKSPDEVRQIISRYLTTWVRFT